MTPKPVEGPISRPRIRRRRFLWFAVTSVTGLLLLLLISAYAYYFEPVRLKAALRQVRSWSKVALKDTGSREAQVTTYRKVQLNAISASKSPAVPQPVIRLMDIAHQNRSSSPAELVSVELDNERRHAIRGAPPFTFSYELVLPQNSSLWFSLNRVAPGGGGGELNYSINLADGSGSRRLFDARLGTAHSGWQNAAIDLARYAGKKVNIEFEVTSADNNAGGGQAYWGDLYLAGSAPPASRPNIFVILLDTLRADHLQCYGYHRSTSPNIDSLAREGVRFENAYSSAPWTDPSILSLFTALYPSDVWTPKPHREQITELLPSSVDTMAEILAANGYFTIAATDHPGINAKRFGQGFDTYGHLFAGLGPYTEWRETPSDIVLDRLQKLVAKRTGLPVFFYVHLIYPHTPFEPPPPYDDYFGRGTFAISQAKTPAVVNMYDGEIRFADRVLGDFLADLRRAGLVDDSIIVFLSDHGEAFWEHGLFEHGNSLYNELLHVPLIIRAPGRLPAGKTVAPLVGTVDVMPTILALAGIDYPGEFRGQSLVPFITGQANSPERMTYSEFPHSRMVRGRAIQSRSEKLIVPNTGGPLEYYDLQTDPRETNSLAEGSPATTARLRAAADEINRSAAQRRRTHPAERHGPDEDTLRKLKTLGYIQ
jgi:arylsulfatase A-like enzyme